MKNYFLSALMIIMLASGCSSPTQDNPSTNTSTPLTTEKVTEHTPFPTTATTPIESTPTSQTHPVSIEKDCVGISANLPSGAIIHDTIVLKNWAAGMLLLKSRNEVVIPSEAVTENNRVNEAFVSPDRIYVMYEQYGISNVNLVFRKANGSGYKSFTADSSWLFYYEWIGNELIRIPTVSSSNTEKLLALDLVNGKYEELRSDFPQLADGSLVNWGIDNAAIRTFITKGVNIVYDPSLARVVYPKEGQFVTLYDVENSKELASIQFKDWGNSPLWSPDGKYLSIKTKIDSSSAQSGDDFFLVSRDGPEFTRLTSLVDLYPDVSIGGYSWSLDSQQIAFWLKTSETISTDATNPYSLVTLDVKTGKMIDTCLSGIGSPLSITISPSPNFQANIVRLARPVWSPDGTQILITQLATDKKNYDVILVDLVEHSAYKIAENIEPIGWMLASQ